MHYNISLLNLLIIFFLRVKQVETKKHQFEDQARLSAN
jgi:hypothetical protein